MGEVLAFYQHNPFDDPPGLVKKRLIERFGYGHERYRLLLDNIVADIRSLAPEFRQKFLHFWNTGSYDPSTSTAGFSLDRLTHQANCTPLAAFLLLSGLVKQPEATAATILQRMDRVTNPDPQFDFVIGGRLPRKGKPSVPGWDQ